MRLKRYTIIANFPESDPLSQYNGASYSTYGNMGKTSAGRIVPVWQLESGSSVPYLYERWVGLYEYRQQKVIGTDKGWCGWPNLLQGHSLICRKIFVLICMVVISVRGFNCRENNLLFYFAGLNISKVFPEKETLRFFGCTEPVLENHEDGIDYDR